MRFNSHNQFNYDQSERFKLYKSGKLWLVAGVTFFSFLGGSILSNPSVHADVTPSAQVASSSSSATSASAKPATSAATSTASATSATSASTSSATSTASQASQATSDANSTAAKSVTSEATSTAAKSTATSTATSQATSATSSAATSTVAKPASVANVSAASQATSSAADVNATSQAQSATAEPQMTTFSISADTVAAPVTAVATSAKVSDLGTDVWQIGDKTRPAVDAVDVASYQKTMTQGDFDKLKAAGIKTAIVKTTEGTSYVNPSALQQAHMANNAGMNVDVYHYAHFNNTDSATKEADHLGNYLSANKFSKQVLVFADMEDTDTTANVSVANVANNLNTFWNTLDTYGYKNHAVYTFHYYKAADAVMNTVGGESRTWIAQYPYTPTATTHWNTSYGAWQLSSSALLPTGANYTGYIDVSEDYNGLLEDSAGTNTFSATATTPTNTVHVNTSSAATTAASGWYTFAQNTSIKSAATDNSLTVGTYDKGSKVYYNAQVKNGSQTWLRYLAASGNQRFVKISNGTTTTKPSTSTSTKPTATKPSTSTSKTTVTKASGAYRFTANTAIKSAAKDSAKTVGTYDKGSTVYYNARVSNGSQTWLRYLAASGNERYVKISNGSTSTSKPASKPTSTKPSTSNKTTVTKASGAYRFTANTAIKSAASDSSKTVGTYGKGSTVYYNARVTNGNQTWLRYLAASGNQRYVKIGGGNAATSKPAASTSSKTTTTKKTGSYRFTANTAIKSAASDSSATVGTYDKGSTVYYNAEVKNGSQTWLRYSAVSGHQRYVKIGGGSAATTTTSKTSSSAGKVTSQRGHYTFKVTTNIRSGASLSAGIVGTYYPNQTVNYVGTVQADGYQWLKYMAASGNYRYVAVVD